MNGLKPRLRAILATGYNHRAITRGAPYDLIFANILARPLCAMACDLAAHLKPGGTAILAGLLGKQVRMVLAISAPGWCWNADQPGPLGDAGAAAQAGAGGDG